MKSANSKLIGVVFQMLLTVTLFSLWAGCALLMVNKLFYKDLPGYTIGRICIWEFIALLIAGLVAQSMIRKWGTINIEESNSDIKLTMNPKIWNILFNLFHNCIDYWALAIFGFLVKNSKRVE